MRHWLRLNHKPLIVGSVIGRSWRVIGLCKSRADDGNAFKTRAQIYITGDVTRAGGASKAMRNPIWLVVLSGELPVRAAMR